jgi:hypothetical protein
MFAASKDEAPAIYTIHTLIVTSDGGVRIERGMYRGDVSHALRYRYRQELTRDVWVYTGYRANLDTANQQGCETAVITFKNDKVVDMQLVNKPAVAVITAKLRLGSSSPQFASK